MNSRTFFTIVIKLIGFYLIIELIKSLTDFFSPFLFMDFTSEQKFAWIIISLFPVVLYMLVALMFFFQTNFIISSLKIENDLEIVNFDSIALYSKFFRLVIIIIGIVAIIDSFPKLCQGLYDYFKSSEGPLGYSRYIIQEFITLFCGVFIITNDKRIFNYLEFRRFTNNAFQESGVDLTQDIGDTDLKKLHSLIEGYTRGIKSNKNHEEILFILDMLCKTREEGLNLLKNYSDSFGKDLLTELKELNYTNDKMKTNLRVFIDLEIVEPNYPHNIIN
jgi:hypothetical protein